jgi:ferritin-like metal-binding protein YciE
MTTNTLEEKFLVFLSGMHASEQRFLSGQQEMLALASDKALQQLLRDHIDESQLQISNLDQIFALMNTQPVAVPTDAPDGLVAEARALLKAASANPLVLNCSIADLQVKVEHTKMACYRTLVAGAQNLGNEEVVFLLQENLQQEERMAHALEALVPTLLETAKQEQPAMTT